MPCSTCDRSDDVLPDNLFEGIRLTLVCALCAATAVNDEGHAILCLSKARDKFPALSPKKFVALGYSLRRNPHYRNAAPMRMYSLAELRVADARAKLESTIQLREIKAKRDARLHRMVRAHNITPVSSAVHQALFEHIFGDYLTLTGGVGPPKRRLKTLKYRFAAHDASLHLCPRDPVRAMNFLETRGVACHPTAVATQLKADFEYSAFLTSRVFRLEGLSISRFLCPADLSGLKNGPLAEVPASVERLGKNARRMLRMTLAGSGFAKDEINAMMTCAAMATRIKRCVKYAHDPDVVAAKMADFWRNRGDRKHRRQVLQDAMHEKGLAIREDSVYCHDYVHGLVDVDLEEIVGIQYITRELFDVGGPRTWRDYHHSCESAFRQALLENGNSMDKSITFAIKRITRGRWF